MGIITDILKGLPENSVLRSDLIKAQKENEALEMENRELKEHLAKYEAQPGEKCPMCLKPTFALTSSKPNRIFGDTGLSDYQFSCAACGFTDEISEDSAGKAWLKARGH